MSISKVDIKKRMNFMSETFKLTKGVVKYNTKQRAFHNSNNYIITKTEGTLFVVYIFFILNISHS